MNHLPLEPQTLRQQLLARTTGAPPSDHSRVRLGDRVCGWASPAVREVLVNRKGLALHAGELILPRSDGALQQVAQCLRQQGLLKGWRGELLDILDDDDQVLGRIERAAMRPLGLRTRAVHLQALHPDGRVWIARRAAHKTTDPGLWDTLVGGLVGAGENLDETLLRESNEEAGLEPAHLQHRRWIGRFRVSRSVPEGFQIEDTQVAVCQLPAEVLPRNRDGEVDEICLATTYEVLRAIADRAFTVEAALSILAWLEAERTGPPPGFESC